MITTQDFILIVIAMMLAGLGVGIGKAIAHDVFNPEPVTVCLPIKNMPTVVCVEGREQHP